jgi:hypothetical protein
VMPHQKLEVAQLGSNPPPPPPPILVLHVAGRFQVAVEPHALSLVQSRRVQEGRG